MKKKDFIYIFILALISLTLFFTNFKPGTFLIGWDNVLPELNFKANLTRNIYAVWQQYRGLGVEDGMAHSANLVHTIFMYLMSFVLPQNVLRYFFHIFAHFLGGLGIYFLLKKLNKKEELSFVGSLFYMFNLATTQMFFAPLEVFSTHFAALPWLILTAINILKKNSKRNVFLFFLASFLSTPQGFVPTVFIAYLIVTFALIGVELVKNKGQKVKEALVIIAIILTTNAFWIFPFVHGALTQGQTIKNAKINQISSDEIYEKNKKRGKLFDILYLKGFMVDIAENNLDEKLVYIMKPWNDYVNQPVIFTFNSLILILVIIGFIKTYKENTFIKLVFLTSSILLATNTPILSVINDFIRDVLPLFGEAFRFPFTKFFIIYVFAYTIMLVSGLEFVIEKYLKESNKTKIIIIFLIPFLVVVSSLPAFTGNFFYKVEKIKVPSQYFETINYFKTQDKQARIMTLPQPSFWNWTYYKWGFRGSGFLWYGIEQPMLERPFDPWSNYNEQYFNEVFYALQTENKELFFKLVDKYDVNFILVDKQISNTNKVQDSDKLINFISTIFPESERTDFNDLSVIKLAKKNNTYLINNVKAIGSKFNNEFIDQSIVDNENYYYNQANWDKYYLFPSLFSNKTQKDAEYSITRLKDYLVIEPKNTFNNINSDLSLKINSFSSNEFYSPAIIELKSNNLVVRPPNFSLILGETDYQIEIFKPIEIKVNSSIEKIYINDKLVDLNKNNKVLLFSKLENDINVFYTNGEICKFQNLEKNPNGSDHDIAGILAYNGRVLGMMPHPERAVFARQNPMWFLNKEKMPKEGEGLKIFRNAVEYFTRYF